MPLILKLHLLISTFTIIPHWLWKQWVFSAHHCGRNVLEKIECVIWPKACQLEQELQLQGLVGKLRYITFLAVNDEVSFLIARRYGVDYTVTIWVLGQNSGDEGVGSCILGNKGSISAKLNKCEKARLDTRKSQVNDGNTLRPEIWIISTVQSISRLIRRMVVAFACRYDLTCPPTGQTRDKW